MKAKPKSIFVYTISTLLYFVIWAIIVAALFGMYYLFKPNDVADLFSSLALFIGIGGLVCSPIGIKSFYAYFINKNSN